jgi:serine/threonine protein kinase
VTSLLTLPFNLALAKSYSLSVSHSAPEVIIGHPYDTRIDIWSVGAVLAELHTGYVLFQNDSVATMLSRITGILGQFPQHVLQRGKDTGKYFSLSNIVYERDDEGAFHLIFPKRTDLASRLHLPAEDPSGKLTVDEELFIDFVRQMLHLDPAQRMTAEEALEHPWLADADTVYVSEYIIQQGPPADGDDQPPLPGDYEDDESVEVSGSGEGEDEEGEEDDDYDYEEGDEELEAAEMEEAALQYLLNAHGGSAEAMEAYLQMQLQAGFAGDDSGDDHYEDGDEGNDSDQGSGVDEAEYADMQEEGEGEGDDGGREGEDAPDSEARAEEA